MSTRITDQSLRQTLDQSGVSGPTLVPGDPGWDSARQAWNLSADQRPAAVVFARDVEDVLATVSLARDLGATIVTQGTGHGAAAYDSLDGSILIRTTRMQELEIDANRCRAGAGVLWGDVAVAAGASGLVGLGGSSPDVGVVGYTLGGGIGWLSRRYGLASNSIRSIGLVTANGEYQRVDHRSSPELFWALRGGGGGLGVVTEIEFDLYPLSQVVGGTLAWDASIAPAVLQAWAEWTSDLDASVSSIIKFLNLPDVAGVPEPFRGRRMLTLGLAGLDEAKSIERQLDTIRRVATPVVDTVGLMVAADLCRLHGDPEGPTAGAAHHTLLDSLGPEAIAALLEQAGVDSDSPLVSVEVRHLGGALAEAPENAGALSHIEAPYLLNAVGAAHDAESAEMSHLALGRTVEAMRSWSEGEYLNFAERATGSVFDDGVAGRLAEVKAEIDPTGVFRLRTGLH